MLDTGNKVFLALFAAVGVIIFFARKGQSAKKAEATKEPQSVPDYIDVNSKTVRQILAPVREQVRLANKISRGMTSGVIQKASIEELKAARAAIDHSSTQMRALSDTTEQMIDRMFFTTEPASDAAWKHIDDIECAIDDLKDALWEIDSELEERTNSD